jgi:hypothetical protein
MPEKSRRHIMKRISGIMLCCALVILSFECQQEKKPPAETKVVPVVQPKEGDPSVSVLENTPVFAEASQKGKPASTLALGEKVLFLDQDKTDSANRSIKYLKIRMSDGKEGWVLESSLAVDARPAVVICRSVIYLRPDLVTITNKEFSPMDFVAISKVDNEWCEARGQENKKYGWIKSVTVSEREDDITVALLASKALAEKNRDKKKEQLRAIISNPSFSKSLFIDTLKTCLAKVPPWDDDEDDVIIDNPDDEEEFDEGE